MAWLLRDDHVLAAVEVRPKRWKEGMQGAVVMRGPALVHTIGAHLSLDVAWCIAVAGDGGGPGWQVRKIATIGPNRVAAPQLRRATMVVAASGAFERWNLKVGDRLQVSPA